jgi:hypothetical protein
VNVAEGRHIGTRGCDWTVPGEAPSINQKKVMVDLLNEQAFAYAKMPVGHGITKIPASSIGDEVICGRTPGYATVLTVKKGSLAFGVHVYGFQTIRSRPRKRSSH